MGHHAPLARFQPGPHNLQSSPPVSAVTPPAPLPERPATYSRRAQLFVTALWGDGLTVESAADPTGIPLLYAHERLLLPPFATADEARAAAAHAGAHCAFSRSTFSGTDLKARQRVLIELFEDARIEALSIERFPGLRALWLDRLPVADLEVHDFTSLSGRLARALLDWRYEDPDAWVSKGKNAFLAARDRWHDPAMSYELGMRLASDLGQMRIAMNEAQVFSVASYRDDNAHLWLDERAMAEDDATAEAFDRVGVNSARLSEEDEGTALPIADATGPDHQSGFELRPADDRAALEYRAEPLSEGAIAEFSYPEWHYRIQRLKADWVTVHERAGASGDETVALRTLQSNRDVVDRLHRQIAAVRYESHRRLRRQLDGDELDIDGLVGNAIDLRAQRVPDQRIYERHHVHSEQELALLVLLDLSASTNDPVAEDPQRRVIDVTRDAAVVLSDALARLGHHFAIHGFNSDGRHAVHYHHLIDFDEPFGPAQRARFGGMRGEYSTRMGAAIRHATSCLAAQPGEHRLLLVITDGEPSDIDVHDRQLLVEDARHAVFSSADSGVVPFCLSLDPEADEYVSHIFGPARFAVLEHITDLPRRLPSVYFRLARRYLT